MKFLSYGRNGRIATGLLAAVVMLCSCRQSGLPSPDAARPRRAVLAWGADAEIGRQIVAFSGIANPRILLFCAPAGDSEAAFAGARAMFAGQSDRIEAVPLLAAGIAPAELREKVAGADIIWVCGGMTEWLAGAWERAALPDALRDAYEHGTVVTGYSAGAICWTVAGYNDFADGRFDLIAGCGALPILFCPHYQDAVWAGFDERLEQIEGAGTPAVAWALTDGAALFFTDGRAEIRFNSPAARACRFERDGAAWKKREFSPARPEAE